VGNLDSPYLIYFLSSVSEAIGYLISMYLNQRFGAKPMFLVYVLGSCISCGLVALVPTSPPGSSFTNFEDKAPHFNYEHNNELALTSRNSIFIALFVSLGKTMISAAFSSAYVYTAVFFPARTRTTMLLLVSSVGRFGSMLSPQVNLLGHLIWAPLTYIIYSASAFLSLVCVFLLKDPTASLTNGSVSS
jgi:MFS family permease